MRAPFLFLLYLVLLLTTTPSLLYAQADSTPRAQRVDIAVSGASLATDVYQPISAAGPMPVVLVRTPYGREAWRNYGEFFARRGYVFLAQDVRGRGASTGQHTPFLDEEADGIAVLDWIVAQPWSNGRVGLMGPSYASFASMVLVAHGHPAIRAVINNSGMIDLDELVFPGGAINLMVGLPWTRLFTGPRVNPNQPWDSLFSIVPVANAFSGTAARAMMGTYPAWNQRLYDAGAIARLASRNVPVLHLTGWNDFLYRHTLRAYDTMRKGTAEQSLMIGPWAHDQQQQPGAPMLGGEAFGSTASFGTDSIRRYALHWFDRHVKGDASVAALPAVRIFTMGANQWETPDAWPAKDSRKQMYHLTGNGTARGSGTTAGLGQLSERVARRTAFDEYSYDPNRPVPTIGGVNFHFFTNNLGPLDQRDVERRADVLSYTTDAFRTAHTLAGPMSVTLYVSSSARDADFTAKLVLVRTDGSARIIEDGIIRARYHRSRREQALLSAGEIVPVTIDLGSTSLTIPAGARLRLEISSGNFPKYDRNPQNGGDAVTATALAPATHRIHSGGSYPSMLTVYLRPSGR